MKRPFPWVRLLTLALCLAALAAAWRFRAALAEGGSLPNTPLLALRAERERLQDLTPEALNRLHRERTLAEERWRSQGNGPPPHWTREPGPKGSILFRPVDPPNLGWTALVAAVREIEQRHPGRPLRLAIRSGGTRRLRSITSVTLTVGPAPGAPAPGAPAPAQTSSTP